MPNKPVNHTDLDNAIKNSLLNNPAEAKVTWEEMYGMLPKKSNVVKGPLTDLNFSLNSFAGVAATGSFTKLKSALLVVKKNSLALYIAVGSIVIGTGSFILYNLLSKNTPTAASVNKVTPAQETVVQKETPVIQQGTPIIDNNTSASIQKLAEPSIAKNSEPTSNTSSGTEVSENPNLNGEPLLKTSSQYEKAPSADEPIQLKTGEPSQNDTYDFSTNDDAVKADTTSENGETKKGKVLYYKESLTLDKLEQQISTDKDQKQINTPTESKGGLFKKRKRSADTIK
ncbi:MAG: hypothetical protein JNL63_00215 [Bacteroidia bacterium]|nr:hypothetical protein [Bacteroidia bacterium]